VLGLADAELIQIVAVTEVERGMCPETGEQSGRDFPLDAYQKDIAGTETGVQLFQMTHREGWLIAECGAEACKPPEDENLQAVPDTASRPE
jgi:hypothetical protein